MSSTVGEKFPDLIGGGDVSSHVVRLLRDPAMGELGNYGEFFDAVTPHWAYIPESRKKARVFVS